MKVPVLCIRLTAALVAIFATGLILTPVETSARSGGFAGGHGIAFHGGFPARTVRPAFGPAFRPAFGPAVRPAVGPAVGRVHGRVHGARHFGQRRFLGAGAPWGAWGYAPYDLGYGYYEPPAVVTEEQPSEEPTPYYEPPAVVTEKPPSEKHGPVPPPPRRECTTKIYKVLSESGGEVPIKVVRC
jgi:hypothetical protein